MLLSNLKVFFITSFVKEANGLAKKIVLYFLVKIPKLNIY